MRDRLKAMGPLYLNLSPKEWEKRIDESWELLNPCRVCPRRCRVDRTQIKTGGPAPRSPERSRGGEVGFCRMGAKPWVSSYHPHFWEEKVLVGAKGSGTIFFTSCNLACVYCQNFEISQLRIGKEVEIADLAKMMLSLQEQGCHNINLVTPTIWVPQILRALKIAVDKGLKLPLVYNTGGYDSVETLKLLEGIVDIYMPDIKYSDSACGLKYSAVPNYWEVVQETVSEMHRQVGDLVIDKDGIARRGLLIRHLVLPNRIAGTGRVMKFIASLSKDSYVNLMDQYYPTNKADQFPELNRRITTEEFQEALAIAKKEGLHRFAK